MALTVFLVPDAQPAQATHGANGHLTGLGITGTVTRDGETYTFPLVSNPWFDPHTSNYTIRVPSDLEAITFTPAWTGGVRGVQLWDRRDNRPGIGGGTEIGEFTVSGTTLTFSSTRNFPLIRVGNTQGAVLSESI